MTIESITTKGAQMSFKISSPFMAQEPFRNAPHTGIDIPLEVGTKLRALSDGVIERIIVDGEKIGNAVVIKFKDGTEAIYGHLSEVPQWLDVGEKVNAGDLIGLSGNTGFSTGPHLHFALKAPNGEWINPEPFANELMSITGNMGPLERFWNGWDNLFNVDKISEFGGVGTYKAGPEGNYFVNLILEGIGNIATGLWHWFIMNLPEIMGYSTMIAAILIIISSMAGKGGMIKPLGWFAGALILAIIILSTV